VTETAAQTRPLRLRGRPPYGYRVLRPAGDPAGARLEPDGCSAPVVRRIFAEYLSGRGLQAIAEGLTADAVSCPSAHDRTRNPHHEGVAWSKGAVRAILVNRRYTGVLRATGTDPVLTERAYPPLVEPETYERVQQTFAAKWHGQARGDRAERVYVFRGLLRCGWCRRLMQGTWNNDEPYYRCRFPEEYASANRIAHPRNVYLRESRLVDPLHGWLTGACAPRRVGDQLRPGDGGYLELLGRQLRTLAAQDPAERARRYEWLGLRLTYAPAGSSVRAKVLLGGTLPVTGEIPL
jgi:site-specific DNA recombinase